MSYHDQLHPWLIICHLPKMQRVNVARFRKRNDAEAHLKALQQMTPQFSYAIIFDVSVSNSPTPPPLSIWPDSFGKPYS